jgi:hypothetical protein
MDEAIMQEIADKVEEIAEDLLFEDEELDTQVLGENVALWVVGKYNVKRIGE